MHIGLATQDPTSHYWMMIGYAIRERAAELGIAVTALHSRSLAVDEQTAAIDTLIKQRVDALLVGPVAATGLAGAIARAHAAGIPVLAVASLLADARVTCTVQSDHTGGAEQAARYIVERLQDGGQLALLAGPAQLQDNILRTAAVRRVLAQHPSIPIVFEDASPDWSFEAGEAFGRAALERHPSLRAICAPNDTLALGVIAAVERAGRGGEVVVTGFDADPWALKAIYEGRLSATVHQPLGKLGRTAVELAQRAAQGETLPSVELIDVTLITRSNLLDAALDTIAMLPSVLADTVERGEALARANDEIIRAQQAVVRELSTPLIPIADGVVVMPLIGTLDSARAQHVLETMLQGIEERRARVAILDVTGVAVVDTQVANALLRAAQAARLLGAQAILTGIKPEVAQTLVHLGADLSGIATRGSLQDGIAYALNGAASR